MYNQNIIYNCTSELMMIIIIHKETVSSTFVYVCACVCVCLRSVVNSFFGFTTSVRFTKMWSESGACIGSRQGEKGCEKSVSHHWVHVNRVTISVRGRMCINGRMSVLTQVPNLAHYEIASSRFNIYVYVYMYTHKYKILYINMYVLCIWFSSCVIA